MLFPWGIILGVRGIAADLDQVSIGIVEVDRSDWPLRAGLFHRAFQHSHPFSRKTCDNGFRRLKGEQTDIARADPGEIAGFLSQGLQVDFLLAHLQGASASREGDCLQPKHPFIKGDGTFDVANRQNDMVDGLDHEGMIPLSARNARAVAPDPPISEGDAKREIAMDKVRYAIVGAGWISQIAFMPAVEASGNAEMTAIVTGNSEARDKLAAFYGIETTCGYEGYDALLASDAVDAVYIALPNSMHADFAIRAMKAGKHAIVEKPLAISVAECEAMIAAAEENGVFLMTAYRLHCEPMTVEVLELLRAGEIGDVKHFTSTFGFQSDAANHRLKGEHWGGPLQDIGVYCLNAARQVMQAEPIEAQAVRVHGNGDPRFAEVEGSIAVTLRFPGDRLAQFVASFEMGDTDTYRIMGTEGVIEVETGYQLQTTPQVRIEKDGAVTQLPVRDSDHFADQIAYFSDCIQGGVAPAPDGVEGLADVIAMIAIEEAARTGQAQPINAPAPAKRPGPDTVRIKPRTERRLVF